MNNLKIGEQTTSITKEETKMNNQVIENLKACKVVTGKVVLYNHHQFQKWSYNDQQTPKFCVTVIISKEDTENLDKINWGINKAIELSENPQDYQAADSMSPLKDGDELNRMPYDNSYYINASTNYQPDIVFTDGRKAPKYLLCDVLYARVSLTFSTYNFNGKKGVSCQLLNVQILDEQYNGTKMISTAEEDFA